MGAVHKTGQIVFSKYTASRPHRRLIAKANDGESPYTVLLLDKTSPGFLSDTSSYLKDLRI